MAFETPVAACDTSEHAIAAVRGLEASGFHAAEISVIDSFRLTAAKGVDIDAHPHGLWQSAPRPAVVGLVAGLMALVISSPCLSSPARYCAPAIVAPPDEPAYADTTWPTEHRDAWRTHAAAGGLPADLRGRTLQVAAVATPPTPTWGYVGTNGQIYVLGGAPFTLDVFTKMILGAPSAQLPALLAVSLAASEKVTPYLARIDPVTMQIDALDVSGGSSVNYIGGVLVHANGYLYAVARGVLFKIDPVTFQIVQSVTLPLPLDALGQPNELTAFNGMQATHDGDLILKGFASVSLGGTPGILLRVRASDLSIRAELESDAVAAARLTVARVRGREFLYVPGQTSSLRFRLEPRKFVPDADYTEPYREPNDGSSPGSSDVFMGEGVVFANNTEPQAMTPMHLFGETASGSSLSDVPAFTSSEASWNFFMVAGDPFKTGIVVVEDQLHGQVSGFIACAGGGSVEKLWENDSLKVSAGAAIAYDRGQLYVDDRRCGSNGDCELFLVVLDLQTGEEIARVPVKGMKPSIGQIFIGPHAVYFPATDAGRSHGYLNRITAE